MLITGRSNVWHKFSRNILEDQTVDYNELCRFLENNSVFPNNLKIQEYYGSAYYQFAFNFIFRTGHISLHRLMRATRSNLENTRVLLSKIYQCTETGSVHYKKYESFVKSIKDIRIDLDHIPDVFLENIYMKIDELFDNIIINMKNAEHDTKIISRIGLFTANIITEGFANMLETSLVDYVQPKKMLKLPIPWAYVDQKYHQYQYFILSNERAGELINVPMEQRIDNIESNVPFGMNFGRREIHHISYYNMYDQCQYYKDYGNVGYLYKYHDLKYHHVYKYFALITSRLNMNYTTIEVYDFIIYILKIFNYYV